MDDQRFDALTRAFARGSSRRTVIKGLFGGVIGGVAVATRLDLVGAQPPCGECPAERPICCGDIEGGTCTTTCCSDADCGGDYCLFIGGDPHNSVCVQCIDDDNCGLCDSCVDNICVNDCPAGAVCCDVEGLGFCRGCCSDDDCEGCSTCNGNGQCEPVECCADSDCGACAYCSEGTCYGECSQSQQCCNDACIDINACCTDADCPDCSSCSEGTCLGECSQGQECCGDTCVPLGQCAHLCIPQSQPCADSQLDCCVGPMCCIVGETSYCAECCADSDCGDCEICDSGVCAPVTDCCKDVGENCGLLDITAADSNPQVDCCDGLVCCYGQSANVCAECCIDEHCDSGGTCEDGVCVYPILCIDDKGCPEHTCCCDDGSCSWHCCDHHHHHHHHPKPPAPTPAAPVTTLPSTGAGQEQDANNLFGAAALGAAAALYAAKKLRDTPETQTEE